MSNKGMASVKVFNCRPDVDNQHFVLYVPNVGYCVLRYIGWIDKTN